MSTVKIKTEPTTTATTTATAADVRVKLEPSLSTGDIKLEQHSSEIDVKVESDSESDSGEDEEDDIKSEKDDDSDENTDQFTIPLKNQRQFICKHPGCGRSFNSYSNLGMHRHEHKLQTELYKLGKTHILTRQSLDDRWACPFSNCTSTYKTINTLHRHIRLHHDITMTPEHHHQPPTQMVRHKYHYVDVDSFYVNGVRCGYHSTIGVFICYECRLAPNCLPTHLQQKHGYDEKSIDNSFLPDSAVNGNVDPNTNQHISNPHLAAAIRNPHWQHHQDIIQGWLCVTSDCGYCGYTASNRAAHKRIIHRGEQISTVPALVLRLVYAKSNAYYFFITRIDHASSAVSTSSNRENQPTLDYSRNGLNAQDENGDDASQNETTEVSSQKRQWKCDENDCERFFNTAKLLYMHRREHKLEVVIKVHGRAYTLTRRSSDDKWACPVPDCEKTYHTVHTIHAHIINVHQTSMKQKRANSEDDGSQQQQPITKRRQRTIQYLRVDDLYVNGVRCGYHNTTGVFICHECRLVPEFLLTHLQQKHGYDEKSVDNDILPESAVTANADPNVNQHTSNPHLASAISQPSQLQHRDIIKGWLCVTSNCGYCDYPVDINQYHRNRIHKGEQLATVPALMLRLSYTKSRYSCFLITRLDATTTNNIKPNNSTNRQSNELGYDSGDELVLSDYSD